MLHLINNSEFYELKTLVQLLGLFASLLLESLENQALLLVSNCSVASNRIFILIL